MTKKVGEEKMRVQGMFKMEHIREGVVIGTEEFHNDVTNIGLDTLLNILFGATSKISTWYAGLIDNAGFTALANADTMASHAGWSEFVTFDETVRQTWGAGSASSQSITNATAITYNISGDGVVKGMFLTSDNTLSGATGTLWSTAAFAANRTVADGDQIKITYTVTAARA